MKKRILIFFTLASLFSKAFSLDIINEIRQSINKIIPSNHTIIDVSIPKYNETEAASEFSKYLEKRIYASLSEMQKSVFSFTTKNKMEEFEAQLSDTGDYESIMNEAAYASKPNGRLFTEFEEIGNTIEISLKYEPLGKTSIGTSQTRLIILHKKDLPFFTYKPENFEQEKEKYSDVKTAKEIIVKSTGSLLINSEFVGIVFIDGEQKGAIKEGGSILIENLQTGSYTIEVKSDMNSFKEKVKITADKPASISIKTGSIKLSSEVAGKVYLNGKYYQDIGSSGAILFARLLEGNYHIEVRTESQTFKQEAKVRVGETTAVAVYNPEEPTVKPVSSKTDTYSDNDDFYAFGYYGSYNLGILPVYKQSDTTTTSQS